MDDRAIREASRRDGGQPSAFMNGIDPLYKMMGELIGQRIVALCGRYIWRGRLVAIEDPFIKLDGAFQTTDHSMSEERTAMPLSGNGFAFLNAMSVESIYLEAEAPWLQGE